MLTALPITNLFKAQFHSIYGLRPKELLKYSKVLFFDLLNTIFRLSFRFDVLLTAVEFSELPEEPKTVIIIIFLALSCILSPDF